jgi:hypothetical protein
VWFVIPKVMINQKYRIKKLALLKVEEGEDKEREYNEEPEEEEVI